MGLTVDNLEFVIETWKKFQVSHIVVEFSCGGDSMNEVSETFYKEVEDGLEQIITDEEVTDLWHTYFESTMYHEISFYECSDGHYQGESGTVKIELNEKGDNFTFTKIAEAEYQEEHETDYEVTLTPEEQEIFQEYIEDFSFTIEELTEKSIEYKKDFIISQEFEQEIEKMFNRFAHLIKKDFHLICDRAQADLEQLQIKGEVMDYQDYNSYNFGSIEGDKLTISVTVRYYKYESSFS